MAQLPKRIIYVDDEFEVRQLVRHSFADFEEEGQLVFATCGSGRELLSRLRELQPDLILLDLSMPEMSGPDMLNELRNREDGVDIPVIFMTGKSKLQMSQDYKSLGVIGVIYKPFSIDALPDQVFGIWCDSFGLAVPADGAGDSRPLAELMGDSDKDTFSEVLKD